MIEESVPNYSEAGLSARDLFFVVGYDVHFFVEDEFKESFYETIFSNLFKRIKSFKVLPLGGKEAILRHAAENPELSSVKRVYVLDKDFDDLHNTISTDGRIFYTDDYCIENALIEERAIVQFAVEESPTIPRAEVSARLSFGSVLRTWLVQLDKLFRSYYIVQKYELEIKNCDRSVHEFTGDGEPWRIDEEKVRQYSLGVANALMARGVIENVDEFDELSRSVFGSGRIYRSHVSGKYLQALFMAFLRHKSLLRAAVRAESMSIRLAGNSDFLRLRRFKRDVTAYVA